MEESSGSPEAARLAKQLRREKMLERGEFEFDEHGVVDHGKSSTR